MANPWGYGTGSLCTEGKLSEGEPRQWWSDVDRIGLVPRWDKWAWQRLFQGRSRPPFHRRRPSFAREVEARFQRPERGSELVNLLHRERVDAVRVLLSTDGRRALNAAVRPLQRAVTTDDLLAYRLGEDDVKNVERLLFVAERIGQEGMREAVERVKELIAGGEGRSLQELLA